ncbi:unnamed protein product [Amoebophrya sp. A25]|nr:unnamed protein product [Amoebophrya sp. A25]|eukprot:GSA25T00023109001.1
MNTTTSDSEELKRIRGGTTTRIPDEEDQEQEEPDLIPRTKAVVMDPTTGVIYSQQRHPFWLEVLWSLEALIFSEVVKPDPVFSITRERIFPRYNHGETSDVDAKTTSGNPLVFTLERDAAMMYDMHLKALRELLLHQARKDNNHKKPRGRQCNSDDNNNRGKGNNSNNKNSRGAVHSNKEADEQQHLLYSTPEKIYYRNKHYVFIPRTMRKIYERSIFGINGLDRVFMLPAHHFNPLETQYHHWKASVRTTKKILHPLAAGMPENRTRSLISASRNPLTRSTVGVKDLSQEFDEVDELQGTLWRRENALATQRVVVDSGKPRKKQEPLSEFCGRHFGLSKEIWDMGLETRQNQLQAAFQKHVVANGQEMVEEVEFQEGKKQEDRTTSNYSDQRDVLSLDLGARRAWGAASNDPYSRLNLLWRDVSFSSYLFSHHRCYGGLCGEPNVWEEGEKQCVAAAAFDLKTWLIEETPQGFMKYFLQRLSRHRFPRCERYDQCMDIATRKGERRGHRRLLAKETVQGTEGNVDILGVEEDELVLAARLASNAKNRSRTSNNDLPLGTSTTAADDEESSKQRPSFVDVLLRKKFLAAPLGGFPSTTREDETGKQINLLNREQHKNDDPIEALYYPCSSLRSCASLLLQGQLASKLLDETQEEDIAGEEDDLLIRHLRSTIYGVHHFDGSWLPSTYLHESDNFTSKLQMRQWMRQNSSILRPT